MPQSTHTNGYTNGHSNGGGLYEMEDQQIFLFTSESVGEGHPGKYNPPSIQNPPSIHFEMWIGFADDDDLCTIFMWNYNVDNCIVGTRKCKILMALKLCKNNILSTESIFFFCKWLWFMCTFLYNTKCCWLNLEFSLRKCNAYLLKCCALTQLSKFTMKIGIVWLLMSFCHARKRLPASIFTTCVNFCQSAFSWKKLPMSIFSGKSC